MRDFWDKHNDAEQALLTWYKIVKKAKWENYEDVKEHLGSARILGGDRLIFNIKGNKYKLIVSVSFENQIVWVRFIGTHAEYDNIDAKEI